jgi:plasmid stabilization system protein ParE
MTYRFTSAALSELRESTLQYEAKEEGLGARFLAEVGGAVGRILAAPEAWRRLSPRTRRCLTHRFPYGVLYQIRQDEILIVSVMDLRRNPVSWRKYL